MAKPSMQDLADPFVPERDSKWYRAMWHFWHPVAYSGDVVEGEMLQGQLLGERILLVRHEGTVRAFMDVCRHKGAAPSLGWIENGCINCPYHGWSYDMEGNLVNIPSRPGAQRDTEGQPGALPVPGGRGADLGLAGR